MLEILKAFIHILRKSIADWFEDNASRQAAVLAYYGVLSLGPLLVIAITIAGTFFGRADVRYELLTQTEEVMGSGSAELLDNVLTTTYNYEGGVSATLISLGVLLFAASNIFAQLKTSLNQIWNVRYDDNEHLLQNILGVIRDRLISAVMVVAFGIMLLVSQMLSGVLAIVIYTIGDISLATISVIQVVNTLISIGFTMLIIGLTFRYLPNKQLSWSDVWVGALFTSILFAIGQGLISFYIENAGVAAAYGVAGSVIVILLWIYFASSILLFGGEFTNAYSELYGSQSKTDSKQP